MSALASLEKFGEEYLVDTLQNEWPLRNKLESEDRKLKFDWLQFINKESNLNGLKVSKVICNMFIP